MNKAVAASPASALRQHSGDAAAIPARSGTCQLTVVPKLSLGNPFSGDPTPCGALHRRLEWGILPPSPCLLRGVPAGSVVLVTVPLWLRSLCVTVLVTRRPCHHPRTFCSHQALGAGREWPWDSPAMAFSWLAVCPRTEPRSQSRSLFWLGTVPPSEKARTGGSSDLMNFYATTYGVSYGQPHFRTCLGHHCDTGYTSNNRLATSFLLFPRGIAAGHYQDTTTEHFKPFWLPNRRSPLPWSVHQPRRGYVQECPLFRLHTGADYHPKAAAEPSTESSRIGCAQPDVLQKITIGTEEDSGFTKAFPRRDNILPVLPTHPVSSHPTGSPVPCQAPTLSAPQGTLFPLPQLGVSITTTDYLPFVYSPVTEMFPSSFCREVPGCLATELPFGYSTDHGQRVTPYLTLSSSLPARRWQHPTWIERSTEDIQHPSGFSTNNHPTTLGDTLSHPLA
ncbi:stabilizer of axonemal microtubules 4 isoform X2 [Nyctibius grandis]|uniref:stabilizer of axonemal microtubules 4 isoform X2 n=1 Tax=Nyctibius grandis TaxID=48427 RepID=UPI0035BC1518